MACLLLQQNSREKQLNEEGLFGCGLEVLAHQGGEGRVAGCSQVVGATWQ